MTLMLAWSVEECGRYIETYKSYEHKPPDLIRERTAETHLARLTDFLTSVKGVNKTDAITLVTAFGNLKGIMEAEPHELAVLPGIGEQKVRRLYELFRQPYMLRPN
jgi:DNA excision repair protein ERCC-1